MGGDGKRRLDHLTTAALMQRYGALPISGESPSSRVSHTPRDQSMGAPRVVAALPDRARPIANERAASALVAPSGRRSLNRREKNPT